VVCGESRAGRTEPWMKSDREEFCWIEGRWRKEGKRNADVAAGEVVVEGGVGWDEVVIRTLWYGYLLCQLWCTL